MGGNVDIFFQNVLEIFFFELSLHVNNDFTRIASLMARSIGV